MALPWTAPGFGQGIYPAQAPFFIPERIDPRTLALIARDREKGQEDIQNIIGSVGQFLQQRRNDQIANQIMNQYQAPRAAAVDPYAYDPTLAKAQGLDYQGPGLTPPATPAFTGGAAGLAAAMKVRELQSQDVSEDIKKRYMEAQIGHLGRLPYAKSGIGGPGVSPVTDPTTGMIWNGRQWVKPPSAGGAKDPWANTINVGRGYYDANEGEWKGDPKGPFVKLVDPKGKEIYVPYESYAGRVKPQTTTPQGGGAAGGVLGEEREQDGVLYRFDGRDWIPVR